MIWFLLGLLAGIFAGYCCCGLLVAGKIADLRDEISRLKVRNTGEEITAGAIRQSVEEAKQITCKAAQFPCELADSDGRTNSLDCHIAYNIMTGEFVATADMVGRCDLDQDGWISHKDVEMISDAVLGRSGG